MELAPARLDEHAAAAPFLVRVEVELDGSVSRVREGLASTAPEALPLAEELRRVVEAGGKRIRPLFCYWGFRAGGGPGSGAIALARVGAALEMLHTAAMMHDDVLDRSRLRRGVPTTFRRLGAMAPEDPERFGRSSAILAGDLAQALADDLLAAADFPAERVVAAFALLNRSRIDATSGEFLDLLAAAAPGDASLPEAHVRRVARLKSGSYSVVGPLQVGAALAGAPASVLDVLRAYGEPLGEAFQLRDDVLGTFGDPGVTGKDRDDDLREGKRTLLLTRAIAMGGPQERRELLEAIGRPELTPEEAESARRAIERTGAVASVTKLIGELAVRATTALDGTSFAPDVRAALGGLAAMIAVREG